MQSWQMTGVLHWTALVVVVVVLGYIPAHQHQSRTHRRHQVKISRPGLPRISSSVPHSAVGRGRRGSSGSSSNPGHTRPVMQLQHYQDTGSGEDHVLAVILTCCPGLFSQRKTDIKTVAATSWLHANPACSA